MIYYALTFIAVILLSCQFTANKKYYSIYDTFNTFEAFKKEELKLN